MRTNHYNRQRRRQATCVRAFRARRRYRIAISPRRLALTADGDDLVVVAERIAAELELPPELVNLMPSHASALTPH